MRQGQSFIALTLAVILSGCGGGGGAATPPPNLPVPPVSAASVDLSYGAIKTFRFTWTDVGDATHYRLLENPDSSSGFVQVGGDIPQGTQAFDHVVPLYARTNAQYMLQSCNAAGCINSTSVGVAAELVESIGYLKASNTDAGDRFGEVVSLSEDGMTLAIGAIGEASDIPGIDGDESSDLADDAGAVYVFVRDGNSWMQQAYVKASNPEPDDSFGTSLDLSADGNTLVVGALREDGNLASSGIGGFDNNSSMDSGAVYVFTRVNGVWNQQAYLKASNTGVGHNFGSSVDLAASGDWLAIGAFSENSDATGVDGDPFNTLAPLAGAVFIFRRDDTTWAEEAYIKASNTDANDRFGSVVSLNAVGDTLAVGAPAERSAAQGIDGDQFDDSQLRTGAAYVFARIDDETWTQQAYIKASNSAESDQFGFDLDLSADGDTLVVGAPNESSNATGVDGNEDDNSLQNAGAVYLFSRDSSGWQQTTYVKASNTESEDVFGQQVSLDADGTTLAVAAIFEGGASLGINGDEVNNDRELSGAVYVFENVGTVWNQQAYVKANNTDIGDVFGRSLALSGDGNTLAIGGSFEDGDTTGVDGDLTDNAAESSGAVYVY